MSEEPRSYRTQVPTFVLDSSIALSWFFADEGGAFAKGVANSMATARAIAPSIWPLEVANAVLVGERRRRSTPGQASTWLAFMRVLPIVIDDETRSHAWGTTLDLGREHALSAYDAAYLELAIRKNLPIATLDNVLKGAAKKLGVRAFEP
jgi:predicted nucleic acid-binding protein